MESEPLWFTSWGRSYNDEAADLLREYLDPGSDPLWPKVVQYRARVVREPARALIDFAYRDLTDDTDPAAVLASLKPAIDYQDRSSVDRAIAVMPDKPLGLDDLRLAQQDLRQGIVRLILAPAVGIDTASWTYPLTRAAIWIGRGGAHTLGPALVDVDPPHAALVARLGRVLAGALPWLRCCDGCGRVFMMLRNQKFCEPKHARFYAARAKRLKSRRGAAGKIRARSKRGAPATYPEHAIEEQHVAWIDKGASHDDEQRPSSATPRGTVRARLDRRPGDREPARRAARVRRRPRVGGRRVR